MAKFDENKVINALHKDRAEIGKKYWVSDCIGLLKEHIENDDSCYVRKLKLIDDRSFRCFTSDNGSLWDLLYPYEEPPKQRMTYRQLAEWMAKGNGEYTDSPKKYCLPMFTATYEDEERDEPVRQGLFIRTWDSDEWVEPTVDIYERDCKGGKE